MKILKTICCFLIFINLSLFSPLVVGDPALIDTVCTKTPYPNDCHGCLAGDPGTSQMTVRELAGSTMYCTHKLSMDVQKGFTDLASQVADPTAKDSYQQCGTSFDGIVSKLSAAMASWWNRDDQSTKSTLSGIVGDYDSCKAKLAGQPELPSDLKGQFEQVFNLHSDSLAVIQQS